MALRKESSMAKKELRKCDPARITGGDLNIKFR